MSAEPKGLNITIMGREFRVACPENEQRSLLNAVDYVEVKMREIRDSGKVIGLERIAIMAALNIAHEHLTAPLDGSFDLGELKRRMNSMKATIEEAMSEQDKLF